MIEWSDRWCTNIRHRLQKSSQLLQRLTMATISHRHHRHVPLTDDNHHVTYKTTANQHSLHSQQPINCPVTQPLPLSVVCFLCRNFSFHFILIFWINIILVLVFWKRRPIIVVLVLISETKIALRTSQQPISSPALRCSNQPGAGSVAWGSVRTCGTFSTSTVWPGLIPSLTDTQQCLIDQHY